MSVEELKGGNGTVKMQFKGEGLDKKDLFGMLLQEHGLGCCSLLIAVPQLFLWLDMLLMKCTGKSDPFLTFSRANGNGSFTVVHKSEVPPHYSHWHTQIHTCTRVFAN